MPQPQTMQRRPPDTSEPTDWTQRVRDALAGMPSPVALPGFDLGSPLPTPDVFDEPIRSLDQTAATFDVMSENLRGVLADVTWTCNDATRFRQEFSGTRAPQLTRRAAELGDLADDLRRIKGRTADEIEWIRGIQRNVRDFLSRVQLAYQAARTAAEEAVDDAVRAHHSATSALQNVAGSAVDIFRAGLDEFTGGDGSDELASAARRAEDAVGNARDALGAVVDFTTGWTFNGTNLPEGVCRAWYDVDGFMAQKARTTEAYGVTYTARGPFQP
jgi:hypothetical protein